MQGCCHLVIQITGVRLQAHSVQVITLQSRARISMSNLLVSKYCHKQNQVVWHKSLGSIFRREALTLHHFCLHHWQNLFCLILLLYCSQPIRSFAFPHHNSVQTLVMSFLPWSDLAWLHLLFNLQPIFPVARVTKWLQHLHHCCERWVAMLVSGQKKSVSDYMGLQNRVGRG